MTLDRFVGAEVPKRSPGPGRQYYLAEEDYQGDADHRFPWELFARTTVNSLSRHADWYRARALHRGDTLEGAISEDPKERRDRIDRMFEQSRDLPEEEYLWGIGLFQHDLPVMPAADGLPGVLALSPTEFAELQDAWEAARLPRDLYYPAREQREVEEQRAGGAGVTSLRLRRYSP